MKPSTLIQILTDGGIEGSQAAVVGVILTSLRCDKCKHWGGNKLTSFCYIHPVYWKNYDFCSSWERKDA